jgi:hypothetical protein
MRQTRITWFLASVIFGLLFIIWGSITNPRPLIPGDVWLVFPGLILFSIGVFGIIDDVYTNQLTLKFLISNEANNHTLKELATILNLNVDHLRELILRLRARGKLAKHYDISTGNLVPLQANTKFCTYCGQPNLEGSFCQVCGMEIVYQTKNKEE